MIIKQKHWNCHKSADYVMNLIAKWVYNSPHLTITMYYYNRFLASIYVTERHTNGSLWMEPHGEIWASNSRQSESDGEVENARDMNPSCLRTTEQSERTHVDSKRFTNGTVHTVLSLLLLVPFFGCISVFPWSPRSQVHLWTLFCSWQLHSLMPMRLSTRPMRLRNGLIALPACLVNEMRVIKLNSMMD